MNGKRIAVTGLGLLTPVGNDVMSSWSAIRAGKSGIKPIEHFDVSEFSTRFGGALQAFDRDKYLPAKEDYSDMEGRSEQRHSVKDIPRPLAMYMETGEGDTESSRGQYLNLFA